MYQKNKKIMLFAVFAVFLFQSLFANSANGKSLSFCFFDIDAKKILSDIRLKYIKESLLISKSNIFILAGIRNKADYKRIKSRLPEFKYSEMIEAEDKNSHLALFSKIKPKEFHSINDLKYKIKKDVFLPIQRGFIYAIFIFNNYKIHLLGADLKNRDKHPLYNQTDMRRYEARRLRSLVTGILKKDKDANILILANLNEDQSKAAVRDVYYRRFSYPKRLFDLRPLDKFNISWTYFSKLKDEYDRIDYGIVSFGLIPEILFDKNYIINYSKWNLASSHRILRVSVLCKEQKNWNKDKIKKYFPKSIREADHILNQKIYKEKIKEKPLDE